MVKNKFKKDYGNYSCSGYSKEYMKAYISWYKSLSKKNQQSIENCNDRATSVWEFRKKKRVLGKTLHKNQKYIDISRTNVYPKANGGPNQEQEAKARSGTAGVGKHK